MPHKTDWRTPRGTHDRLPIDEPIWRFITKVLERRADGFGFQRIETPIFETDEVFTRSLGDTTDVILKEMFEVRRATQTDGEGDDYILRPEGTAPIIRAYLEHGMHTWPLPSVLAGRI